MSGSCVQSFGPVSGGNPYLNEQGNIKFHLKKSDVTVWIGFM